MYNYGLDSFVYCPDACYNICYVSINAKIV
jgi:hypothetical protein